MSGKKQCKWYPVCPIRRYTNQGKLDKKWVNEYCFNENTKCIRYKMEEAGKFHPDNMLPNGEIDPAL